jgi:hypothetical protein
MPVTITKPQATLRELLATLKKRTGLFGEQIIRAETAADFYNVIGQNRNRIINGAMTISQRGASPTIAGGGEYSLDRFGNYYSGNAFTSVQSTTAPAGFTNSMLFTITTASASPTYSFFYHKIEGFNCADLAFGTSSASPVTLSFWVRSSVAGVYSIAIGNSDADRAYAVQYTINSANTWEQKTMTVAGDQSGTWPKTNGTGIMLRWNLGTSGGRLISAGSWQAANVDGATGSTGANAWANTSGATFYITGVQLERGTVATPFDVRPYGTELQLCQRYYQTFCGDQSNQNITMFQAYSTTNVNGGVIPFFTKMRSVPTFSYSALSDFYIQNATGSGTAPSVLQISANENSTTVGSIRANVATAILVAGNAAQFFAANTNARLNFSAEL